MQDFNSFINDDRFKAWPGISREMCIVVADVLKKSGIDFVCKFRVVGGTYNKAVFVYPPNINRRLRNIITITAWEDHLEVLVYWGEDNKIKYKVKNSKNITKEMMAEIKKKYDKLINYNR